MHDQDDNSKSSKCNSGVTSRAGEEGLFLEILILDSVTIQVLMVNKSSHAKVFTKLEPEDKDLIMFTITDLKLEKRKRL